VGGNLKNLSGGFCGSGPIGYRLASDLTDQVRSSGIWRRQPQGSLEVAAADQI
jgi:hypothetical protein